MNQDTRIALDDLAVLDEGEGYCDCLNDRCSRNVWMHDELTNMAEDLHGHPGHDCPETPQCTDRLKLAFILERGKYMSLDCLRNVVSPLLGHSVVYELNRRRIMASLRQQLMNQSAEYQGKTDWLLAKLAKTAFTVAAILTMRLIKGGKNGLRVLPGGD